MKYNFKWMWMFLCVEIGSNSFPTWGSRLLWCFEMTPNIQFYFLLLSLFVHFSPLSVFLFFANGSWPLSPRPDRLQRRVSMETRQRQRTIPQSEVHSVRTGGRPEVFQQEWCECFLQIFFSANFYPTLSVCSTCSAKCAHPVVKTISVDKEKKALTSVFQDYKKEYWWKERQGCSADDKCLPPLSQAREPKAIMKINSVNATFQPAKIGTSHGLQITYLKDNSTRNIFVYHEDGKVRRIVSLFEVSEAHVSI